MPQFLQNCNKEQKQAITHGNGPAMILAGPGSGKTFVITNRIHYLVKHMHVPASQIAVITFTKAAAIEMRKRAVLLSKEASFAVFGTFHSIFYQILRSDYSYHDFSVLETREKNQIIRQILYTRYCDAKEVRRMTPILSSLFSFYFNTGEIAEEGTIETETFMQLLAQYKKECMIRKKFDFDLILTECFTLLRKSAATRRKWQSCFQHILIDEFQDSNEIQYRIVRLLVGEAENLFVVGDDDQSIYRFRGANPQIMFRFMKDYPQAEQIILRENYRSCTEILSLAGKFVKHNTMRFDKALFGHKQEKGEAELFEAENIEDETDFIIRKIKEYKEAGTPLSEMAILCRTSARFRYLQMKLKKNGIVSEKRAEERDFYEKKEVEEILCYLKFAFRGKKRRDLLPVLNKPERSLSQMYFDEEITDFERVKFLYRKVWKQTALQTEENEVMEHIEKLKKDIKTLEQLDPYGCICYILHIIGYEDFCLRTKSGQEAEECRELLEELKLYAREYESVTEWLSDIEDEVSREFKTDRRENQKEYKGQSMEEKLSGVRLNTYHGSKGLEFTHVFLPFVNGYIVPHKKAADSEEIEEERRMFYVAMTRAKESLHISYIKEKIARPSIFIRELRESD